MRLITAIIAIAAVIAIGTLLSIDQDDAHAQNPAQISAATTGCESLTQSDWEDYWHNDHIDTYDPAVVTPTNYLKIDKARQLVWFAGKAHGREGFTECTIPDPSLPPPTPTSTPTSTPTPTATPDLIGCRWPSGYSTDFSAPISPIYQTCLNRGGQLEYRD